MRDRLSRSRVGAVVTFCAVAGLFAVWLVRSSSLGAQVPPAAYIEQPENWVPFSAYVLVTHPDVGRAVGRYYRSSDGSFRRETGPALDDIRVIDIMNVSAGVRYFYGSRTGWGMAKPTRIGSDAPSNGLQIGRLGASTRSSWRSSTDSPGH